MEKTLQKSRVLTSLREVRLEEQKGLRLKDVV